MKTVFHIESSDDLFHLLNPNRQEGDTFPFLSMHGHHLVVNFYKMTIEIDGPESSKYKLELSKEDVREFIVSIFSRSGIDILIGVDR